MKKLLSILTIAFMAIVLVACNKPNETSSSIPVESTEVTSAFTLTVASGSKRNIGVGETTQLVAKITPSSGQTFTWSSSNPDVAIVDDKGLVTGVSVGSTIIFVTSSDGQTKKISIQVGGDEYPDLGGYEIKIAYSPLRLNEIDPRLDNYTGTQKEKEYKIAALEKVESEYHCTISYVGYPTTTDDARWDYISQQGANNVADMDFYWIPTKKISDFADLLVDLTDLYGLYGHDLLNTADREARKYKQVLYGFSSSQNSMTADDPVIACNYNLLKEIGMEEPAKLFLEDKWTMTDFKAWVIEAQEKLDNKGLADGNTYYVISGPLAYYVRDIARTCGVPLADTVNSKINTSHETVVKAATLLHDLYVLGCVDPENQVDEKVESWNAGHALLCTGSWYWVNDYSRWPSDLWGEGTTQYAFCPYPYDDDMTFEDAKVATYLQDSFVMPKARANNYSDYGSEVTVENIFRAYSDLFYFTKLEEEKDATYDEMANRRARASEWSTEKSVEAWLYFDVNLSSKTIFDPIKEIINCWSSDWAKGVAAYISAEYASKQSLTAYNSYAEAIKGLEADIIKAFIEKYN